MGGLFLGAGWVWRFLGEVMGVEEILIGMYDCF